MVVNGGKTARPSSSWTAGSDSPRSTCTSWWWTCPLCNWRAAEEAGGGAEEAEPRGVEVGPSVSLDRQGLLGLLLEEGRGLRVGVCALKSVKQGGDAEFMNIRIRI